MSVDKVPALSVRQPWAELILTGRKKIEIRSWATAYRGPLWLHASSRADRPVYGLKLEDLFKGGFVGRIDLVAIVPFEQERWEQWRSMHLDPGSYQPGLFAWIVESPIRLSSPLPAPGALKLFSPDLATTVRLKQLAHDQSY